MGLLADLIASNKPYYGAHSDFDKDNVSVTETITGKRPTINGFPINQSINLKTIRPSDRPFRLNQIINLWNKGVVTHVSMHLKHPISNDYESLETFPNADIDSVMPGGAAHDAFMEDIDWLVDFFLDLKTAGVELIFRPWHEMNGGWFWWGQGSKVPGNTPAKFKAFYNYTVEYFKDAGCDNIVWCWAPNIRLGTRCETEYNALYPGNEHVDLIGLDSYVTDPVKSLPSVAFLNQFASSRNKALCLSEFGHSIKGFKGLASEATYYTKLAQFASNFPFVFMMTWGKGFSPVNPGVVQDDFLNNFVPTVYLIDDTEGGEPDPPNPPPAGTTEEVIVPKSKANPVRARGSLRLN